MVEREQTASMVNNTKATSIMKLRDDFTGNIMLQRTSKNNQEKKIVNSCSIFFSRICDKVKSSPISILSQRFFTCQELRGPLFKWEEKDLTFFYIYSNIC